MLHLFTAGGVRPLVDHLGAVLSENPADPMRPEWLATPSVGLREWLKIELARRVGAGVDGGDGVAANLDFTFPGALVRLVATAGGHGNDAEPWEIDRLVWAVLAVLDEHRGDPRLGPVAELGEGATAYGQARHIADLFDRYGAHRPAMLQAWARGADLDGDLGPLSAHVAWQPRLFRLVRDRIGCDSPAERLPGVLARVRDGSLRLDLPERLSMFGLTDVPGGTQFLDTLTAVSVRRDVHLFLHHPSPAMADRVRDQVLAGLSPAAPLRVEESPIASGPNPLLQSWAQTSREAAALWARHELASGVAPRNVGRAADEAAGTLLARLQADLRGELEPSGELRPAENDRSVEVHSCYGPVRQVEVLRDAILQRLAADPSLREDEILVVCPTISTYAPIIEAVFGASDESVAVPPATHAAPRLSYRLTDRSLRESYPTLAALAALLDLVAGRFSAAAVVDFVSLQSVRDRYELSDDDIATISRVVADADVKWGLDGGHRARWGLPASYGALSWSAALDRLLVGVAASDDPDHLAVGDVLPIGVEGDDVAVVGRFADLMARVAALASAAATPRAIGQWCDLLTVACNDLIAAPADAPWQRTALHRILADVAQRSELAGEALAVELTLGDVRRLLSDSLTGAASRPDFFRGGVTISSLTPLRGVPYRVVCILGMDEEAFGASRSDGDDLVAAAPHIGDRDDRAETRQALLETVLAAQDQLVVTCTGRSLVTNLPVPPATPLAELREAIVATTHEDERARIGAQLDRVHPRQAFDAACFVPGRLGTDQAWSFDRVAHAAALAGRNRVSPPAEFLEEPLPAESTDVIELGDLHEVLSHPVKGFLTRKLQLHVPFRADAPVYDLPVVLSGLDRWRVAGRLLDVHLRGGDAEQWAVRERAAGSLPPGVLGEAAIVDVTETVDRIVAEAVAAGHRPGAEETVFVDFSLGDGTRIVGSVADCHSALPGPLAVSFTTFAPKHRLAAWIDLMALVAANPDTPWRAVVIGRAAAKKQVVHVERLVPAGSDPQARREHALEALGVAVDCYRRALCRPVPLFAKTSAGLADGTARAADWRNDHLGYGDGLDVANQIVFGDLAFDELCAIPAHRDDPPGRAAGRAKRWADYLWSAVEQSVVGDEAAGEPA